VKVGFTLNETPTEWDVHPGETLFETLQREGFYTKKRGCNTGDCGVCIVKIDGDHVHSCQIFAASVEAQDVRTIEGIVYKSKKTGEVIVKPKPTLEEVTAPTL
jgi:aerobic carbon-monoxide dehydrogenase small subunit